MDERLIKTQEYFDKAADKWDENFKSNEEFINAGIILSGLEENAKIADIACGTGVLFGKLLEKNPSSVYGIDISQNMLDIARKKYDDERISLFCGDFMDFEETDFDMAFIFRAYPHFEEKEAFAKKLHEVLKKGGRFIILHHESRRRINGRHEKIEDNLKHDISDKLLPVDKESLYFEKYFNVDIKADTESMYIISGVNK